MLEFYVLDKKLKEKDIYVFKLSEKCYVPIYSSPFMPINSQVNSIIKDLSYW